jgi:dihydrofolate reductase
MSDPVVEPVELVLETPVAKPPNPPAVQSDDPAALKAKIELLKRDLAAKAESNARLDKEVSDLRKLVNERLKPTYKNIWLVGGAVLVKDFIRLDLADEIRLTIVPILLGDGTPFFDQVGRERPLHLMDVTAYKNGMVELRYEIKKS